MQIYKQLRVAEIFLRYLLSSKLEIRRYDLNVLLGTLSLNYPKDSGTQSMRISEVTESTPLFLDEHGAKMPLDNIWLWK
jgi:hypothetical protein